MRLEKKVAIVTGGGTGIGEAIAKRFAQERAKVVITGRRKEVLEKVATEIAQAGGSALAVVGSVTVESEVQEAIASTLRKFGRIDILVNNAGNLFHAGPIHETSGRLGVPQEIAEAAVYFASDESSWTTGSILAVDGGVMAQ